MENVILCSGKYADTPFYVEEECLNLYSIEELCYYMFKNAWLLENSFVSDELLSWIEEELSLPQLAQKLKKVKSRPDTLCLFIETIIRETGYYEEEKTGTIRQILSKHGDMNVHERRKCRADAYLRSKRFAMAADEYEKLLWEIDDTQPKLRAKLFHNLGVCAAEQFLYEKAARYFKQAYDTYANTESYVQYLTAQKLYLTDAEYLTFLGENPESYEDSLEVECRIRSVKQGWEADDAKNRLDAVMEENREGTLFYTELENMTEGYKNEYRGIVYRSNAI